MRHYSHQEAMKLALLEIKANKEALTLFAPVIEVLRKFNGKVANKRLDTALKKIDSGLSFRMRYSAFCIDWHIKNRHFEDPSKESYSYIHESSISLLHSGEIINKYGRINADSAIEQLNKQKDYISQRIEKAEKQLADIDEKLKQRNELKKQVEEFNKDISYLVDGYFNIRINLGG